MIKVCARYNGTTILLEEFENHEDAVEFMKHDYVLCYSDELEDEYEDEIIYTDEMFIFDDKEEIPFTERLEIHEEEDLLPF